MATHSSILGLPLWLSWQGICLQCGRPGFDPWVGKIPWRRERLPTPAFWPGEFHGLDSPWACKESDTTEQLALSVSLSNFLSETMEIRKGWYNIFSHTERKHKSRNVKPVTILVRCDRSLKTFSEKGKQSVSQAPLLKNG